MIRTALIAAAITAVAGVAIAKTPVVVKLETPKAEQTRIIANGAVFMCEGDTCTAVMTRAVNARTCGEVAEQVGRIVQFSGEGRSVTGADLDRCNAKAPQLPTTTEAGR